MHVSASPHLVAIPSVATSYFAYGHYQKIVRYSDTTVCTVKETFILDCQTYCTDNRRKTFIETSKWGLHTDIFLLYYCRFCKTLRIYMRSCQRSSRKRNTIVLLICFEPKAISKHRLTVPSAAFETHKYFYLFHVSECYLRLIAWLYKVLQEASERLKFERKYTAKNHVILDTCSSPL